MKINPLHALLAALGLGGIAVLAKKSGSINVIGPRTLFAKPATSGDRTAAATLVAETWYDTQPPSNWLNAKADSPQIRQLVLVLDPSISIAQGGVITLQELATFLGIPPKTFANMVQKRHKYTAVSQTPVVAQQQKTTRWVGDSRPPVVSQVIPPIGTFPPVASNKDNALRAQYNRIYGIKSPALGYQAGQTLAGADLFGTGTLSASPQGYQSGRALAGSDIFGTGTLSASPQGYQSGRALAGSDIFGTGTLSATPQGYQSGRALTGSDIFGTGTLSASPQGYKAGRALAGADIFGTGTLAASPQGYQSGRALAGADIFGGIPTFEEWKQGRR